MMEERGKAVEQVDPFLARGTSLQAEIVTSWDNLTAKLGPAHHPDEDVGHKTSTRWVVSHRGNIFTVYDYKMSDEYDTDGEPVGVIQSSQEREWQVGAYNKEGVDEFVKYLVER